jgi:hypothetical protein
MDDFSIPQRIESVAPTEPTRRQGFSSDRRRPRNSNPVPPEVQEDAGSNPPEDDEDVHEVDEIA